MTRTLARSPLRVVAATLVIAGAVVAGDERGASRLERVRAEIAKLRLEARELAGRERGLLGELARMDADIALRRAELEEATLRLDSTEAALVESERELARLDGSLAEGKPQVAAELRALYTRGLGGRLALMLGAVEAVSLPDGIRYAGFLARRESRRIASWHDSARRLGEEREALAGKRVELATARDNAGRLRRMLEVARREREASLRRIRGDRAQYESAIGELETAAGELARVVAGVIPWSAAPPIDLRSFRGLLDWPADGPVSARFGSTIHPKFKTTVPHPGLDIDAPDRSPFRSIFDGRVAYAEPLHGYGLTVVVDHGNGFASVYAHASVLLVSAGQTVGRGEELGRVGESGSFRGPYLYFELRDQGKPVDPAAWLRRH